MFKTDAVLSRDIYPRLGPGLRSLLQRIPPGELVWLQEIRLRLGRPVALLIKGQIRFLSEKGLVTHHAQGIILTQEELDRTLQLLTQGSLYALEEELRQGYVTLPGGHRVGFVGQGVMEGGSLARLKNIGALNIRISRELPGVADRILPSLFDPSGGVYHTLIISPPGCGKTTLLRDVARQLSYGGYQVSIADERSEIAGSYRGKPQLDVGPLTDVLDGVPKAQGIMLLLRAMSPQVIVTDEIGRQEDALALREAVNCGVSIITSAHGRDLAELKRRPIMAQLIEGHPFDRFIILSNRGRVGRVEEIRRGQGAKLGTYSPLSLHKME
ncbi:MAG: stage III sporulation protein AA [Limnochordia bacterium]